jgi:hypothetical protein
MWSDTSTPLEGRVPEIAQGLLAASAARRQLLEDLRLDSIRHAEEKRRDAEHAAIRQREQARCDRFFQTFKRWERAERLRAYIAAVVRAGVSPEPEMDVTSWAAWVSTIVNDIDPLVPNVEE